MKNCKPLAFFPCLLLLLLTGCPSNQYTIELTPHDSVLARKLTFYRGEGVKTNGEPSTQAFPAEELAAINRLYPATSVKEHDGIHEAAGDFAGNLPVDVGGAGSYTNIETSLGSAHFYVERFRGSPDIAAAIAKRSRAADELVDLVIGWMHAEIGDESGYRRLKKFLDTDFRKDVHNLSLYGWMNTVATMYSTNATADVMVRVGQFLMERGYVSIADLPAIYRMFGGGDKEEAIRQMRRVLVRQMGLNQNKALPKAFGFLADSSSVEKSFENYVASTPKYRERLRKWEKARAMYEVRNIGKRVENAFDEEVRKKKPAGVPPFPEAKPEPGEIVGELFAVLANFRLFDTPDRVDVRLKIPTRPLFTNGKWVETARQVTWNSEIESRDSTELPIICYATWCVTKEPIQITRFGRVVLKDADMLNYALWRGGLTAEQGREWEHFLEGVAPSEDWETEILSFRFSMETPPPAGAKGSTTVASDALHEIFSGALKEEEKAAKEKH